jgi:hypothetical protein
MFCFPAFACFGVGAATDGSECPMVQCSSGVFVVCALSEERAA